MEQTGTRQVIEIYKLIYHLAKDDDMSDVSLSQDPCFLSEFIIKLYTQIEEVENEVYVFFHMITVVPILFIYFDFRI